MRKINIEIDRRHELDALLEKEKVKLLLLGAGESGKSTIFKQMKLIYGNQYTILERMHMLVTIHININQAIKILCEQASEFNLVDEIMAKEQFNLISSMDYNEGITKPIGDAIKLLWNDPIIQAVWERRAEFQIIESIKYYIDRIDIIKMPDYLPSIDDILNARVRTSGIVSDRYVIDSTVFEMYDVGGQRNERKKWIHCFEGVTAVIFVVALSEYDQKLFEDICTNRMTEALNLFEDVCNNSYFANSSMILFLNKRDLFADKIKVKNIRDYPMFSDYTGPDGDYNAGIQYFLDKFLDRNKAGAKRKIYNHVTCATDTRNVRVVFNACKDIILRENLKSCGFMN